MLIFDGFPSSNDAEAFVKAVSERFKLEATVFDGQDESDEVDPFPFVLSPPIVLVERPWNETEDVLSVFVRQFGGNFAGT